MTGRTIEYAFPPRPRRAARRAELLAGRGPRPGAASSPTCRFTVRAGEIVGLAGLVGSGRSEILETVYGARRRTRRHGHRGRARAAAPAAVDAAVRAGLGLAPEERKSQALLLDEPVVRNVSLSTLPRFSRGSAG